MCTRCSRRRRASSASGPRCQTIPGTTIASPAAKSTAAAGRNDAAASPQDRATDRASAPECIRRYWIVAFVSREPHPVGDAVAFRRAERWGCQRKNPAPHASAGRGRQGGEGAAHQPAGCTDFLGRSRPESAIEIAVLSQDDRSYLAFEVHRHEAAADTAVGDQLCATPQEVAGDFVLDARNSRAPFPAGIEQCRYMDVECAHRALSMVLTGPSRQSNAAEQRELQRASRGIDCSRSGALRKLPIPPKARTR